MFYRLISNILPHLPKKLVWQFSKEYVAGETIEDAMEAKKKLNEQGILTTIDVLGEFIKNLDEAEANKNEYHEVIEAAEAAGVLEPNSNL
jgi:proline dehydrogenase